MKINAIFKALAVLMICASCAKESDESADLQQHASLSVEAKLELLGFDLSEGFYETDEGLIVEHDILFTELDVEYHYTKYLNGDTVLANIRFDLQHADDTLVSSSEARAQYRTQELVRYATSAGRTIPVYLDPSLDRVLGGALQGALNRYNQLPIRLSFLRTTNLQNALIRIVPTRGQGYLMAAGFPRQGNPYHQIIVNTDYYNLNSFRADATSTLAHEIGHCIGLRHTDFMDRRFSCGGTGGNEGSAGVGAIHIPGTPTQPEANSFMLACSNGRDRPFTMYDRIALQNLYR